MSELDTLEDIRDYLAEEFGIKNADSDEMIEMLIDSLISEIQELKDAVKAGNADAVKSIGHALKGSASNLGASHLAEIGKTLETHKANGDFSKSVELITDIEESLQLLQQQRP